MEAWKIGNWGIGEAGAHCAPYKEALLREFIPRVSYFNVGFLVDFRSTQPTGYNQFHSYLHTFRQVGAVSNRTGETEKIPVRLGNRIYRSV